jgi:hypothetical protein
VVCRAGPFSFWLEKAKERLFQREGAKEKQRQGAKAVGVVSRLWCFGEGDFLFRFGDFAPSG